MALRIGSIIVPVNDNTGKPMEALHRNVEAWLCTVFGGFTAQLCIGAWVNNGKRYDDENVRYDVYYHDRSEQGGWIRDIAHKIMENSDQLAVAIIMSGNPQIIAKRKVPKLTAAAIKQYNQKREGLCLDLAALDRLISRQEGLRPSNGGKSPANDAVLGLKLTRITLASDIAAIDKVLKDDRANP